MINPFYEKLAKLAVNYSIKVKKGHRVRIVGPAFTTELFQALYAEVVKAGGHPWLEVTIEGTDELLMKHASEEQLLYVDNLYRQIYEEFDSFIRIRANYNTRKLSRFDTRLISKRLGAPDRKILKKNLRRKSSKW